MDLSGWVVAIGTLGLLFYTVRYRGQDMGASKLNARLKPIEDTLERFQKNHVSHFEALTAQGTLLASVEQRQKDHEKHDEDRFGRIEEMHREIREDIKELLRR